MQQRKKYTKEFKLDAVSLVNDQGYSRIEDDRRLVISGGGIGSVFQEGGGLEYEQQNES